MASSDEEGGAAAVNPMEVFVEETKDDSMQVQIGAIRRLRTMALSLGEEKARDELMPYLAGFVETSYVHDEILLNISEQLEDFLPLVGGPEHSASVLDVLEKLCAVDETIVRQKAVDAMRKMAETADEQQIEKDFVPLIQKLSRQEWFTTKCSATGLFAACYPKAAPERRAELRAWFKGLMQDDSPMVRRSAAHSFVDFARALDVASVREEFVEMLDCLVLDAQDSVRILAVGVAMSVAAKLDQLEDFEEVVWKGFKALGDDASWRVRCQVAGEIAAIQTSVKKNVAIENLLHLYHNLVHDQESQVREAAAKSLVLFCRNLVDVYGGVGGFEAAFQDEIMPLIKELYTDASDEVRIALSSVLLSLSTVLGAETVKNDLLPIVKASIEHDDSPKVKENIIKNLDSLIDVVGFADVIDSVRLLIEDLVGKSESQWRTRRSILVTFAHLAKHSGRRYFDEHLLAIYLRLIGDPVFAVRRTAPLIFPLLAKSFGMSWAATSLLPSVFGYASHANYLYRFTTLFGIDELVFPTLADGGGKSRRPKYLRGLEKLCNDDDAAVQQNATYVLVKLIKLHEMLVCDFEQGWVEEGFDDYDLDETYNDDIRSYAEDALEGFTKDCDYGDVFDVTRRELTAGDGESGYLEGVLVLCLNNFMALIETLLKDPVANVRSRAQRTLVKVEAFVEAFGYELGAQAWVDKVLARLSPDDVAKIEEKLREELLERRPKAEPEPEPEQKLSFDEDEFRLLADNIAAVEDGGKGLEGDIVQILDEKLATSL